MARAALAWSTQDLARHAEVGVNTVNRFEAGQDARVSSVEKMRTALERAGLEFIPENGGGAGIRFRDRAESTQRGRGASANDPRDATLEREIESNPDDWD